MKRLKRILKLIGVAILSFIGLVGIYLCSAYILSRISVEKENSDVQERNVTIYILTNGVHTDLVLPVRSNQIDWSKEIRFENTLAKDTSAQFVALGWGDKGFYLETPTWDDLKFSTAFKAAFSLSSSAIHATFYKKMREGNDCKRIQLSKEEYSKLIKYIRYSFTTNADGHVIPIKTHANYGNNDAFYEANGSYNLFQTCNTWANSGLKSCGQKACLWTPFDTGIFYHYQ